VSERLLRLKEILGDKKSIPPTPAIIPVSKATWYAGIKSGRFPQKVSHLGPKISAWRSSEVFAMVAAQ
jgi:predicted DNA-binding transcriptional regulator AlpA